MADISDIQATDSVKIVGSDATGTEQTPVQSTSAGGLHVNVRNAAGTEVLVATETTLAALNTSQTNGLQRVQLVDSANAKIDTLNSGTGLNAINVAMTATNYVLSSANTTVAQLGAGATFTGTLETIFNQQTASLIMTSDQPGTLTLNQYIDAAGTRRVSQWVYTIIANVPFSRSFAVNGNYFNLTFQNTGAATTTTLNINSAYGTLPSATNLGNSNVSLDEVNGTSFSLGTKVASLSLPVTVSENARYSATAFNIASAAAATDVFTITGSATKTVRVTSLKISGNQTTLGTLSIALTKRSTANSGGTFVSQTILPLDSAYPAATATVLSYTANPTVGTGIANFNAFKYVVPASTSTIAASDNIVEMLTTPVILRGTSQVLAVNFLVQTVAGGNFTYAVTFEEI
jgi:hypothetical protein